ncbi:MAG: LptF/LptG family permease [Elusimicrobiota bacterium]
MKILTKYTISQFFSHTLLGLMFFSFILLMDRVFQLADLLITRGVSVGEGLILLMFSLPTIIVISAPMSILAGSVITTGKMASDGEITVLRTSGSTLGRIFFPMITAGILLFALMIPFNYTLAPNSQYIFRKKFMNIAFKNPAIRLEESTLIELPPYTLLCFEVNRNKNTLREIIIYRESQGEKPAMSISARKGEWKTTDKGELILTLYNGTIKYQPASQPQKLSVVDFADYTLKLTSSVNKKVSKSIETMTGKELRNEIKRLKNKQLPFHKLETRYYLRGALAGAIPVLLLIGIPLGIRAENKGKTIGIGISLGVIAVYYFLMVSGIKLSFNRTIAPWLGVWLPNIIAGLSGLYLLVKSMYK